MRVRALLLLPLAPLGACHERGRWGDANGDNKTVHIAVDQQDGKQQLSLNIPGVDARLALPKLDLSRHVDLDGIRLAPDTIVTAIDVAGQDGAEDGRVRLSFTNRRSPAMLLDYYARAATQAGYGDVSTRPGALDATKGDKRFALSLAADGAGSRGTIVMEDGA